MEENPKFFEVIDNQFRVNESPATHQTYDRLISDGLGYMNENTILMEGR